MRTILFAIVLIGAIIANANPVDRLLDRIEPGASRKFKTELVKSDTDFFELDQKGDKVVVRGNSWVNVATGINWYLKYYAGVHLSWNGMSATLPTPLPRVDKPERHETDLSLRYNFNYCTFSYSMAFWDWERWEKEIDWMALHGVNMPLACVGQECVWRNVLLRLGYTEEEVGRFIAGPAFLAWWAMNNLEGWGGPLPHSWYADREALQKKILARMDQLGMQPVIPGYCGMMPHDAHERLGVNATPGGTWNGYVRPANLSAMDPRFDEIADLYYRETEALFGRWKYYSLDPFHETGDDDAIDYAAAGHKLMDALKRANPKAVWVVQGWTENPRPEMIDALPEGDLLVLDLFSECRPMWGAPSVWKRAEGYGKHHWLFCMLENFGANVGLHGRIDQIVNNFELARSASFGAKLKGAGFTMEGSENNPVMFELMSELPWRAEKVDRSKWLDAYVKARYGRADSRVLEAWQLLGSTIYNCPAGNNQQGPHESIFCGRPSLTNFQVKSWSKMRNYYDPSATLRAAALMAEAAPDFRGNNNFEYDLVDIVRQALSDQGRLQYLHTIADYNAFARDDFRHGADRFLDMLLMQDRLLGTRSEFRLGRWTEQARSLGHSEAEKDLMEWNARVQITTWGNRNAADAGGLRDYANKEWNGLLRDFYHHRWATYFDALDAQMAAHSEADYEALGEGANSAKTADELFAMARPAGPNIDWYAIEEPWTLQKGGHEASPEGDAIEIAREVVDYLLAK